MKSLIMFLTLVLVTGVAYGFNDQEPPPEEKKVPEVMCPVSRYTDNDKCSSCHTMLTKDGKPTFGLKEVLLQSSYSDMPYPMKVVKDTGRVETKGQFSDQNYKIAAYLKVEGIMSDHFENANRYFKQHPEITKLIVEIHSGGGSVMSAWRIVGLIQEMQARGIIVETRCYGMALSAGGFILIAGDIGHRYVAPHAEIMIHKIWNFSMFEISNPDSAEDKANLLKHLQSNINQFFEERTKLSAEIINSKSYHKSWWFNGAESLEYGIADHLITE
jgi:ATP-dependent protease ClpP protease subunit